MNRSRVFELGFSPVLGLHRRSAPLRADCAWAIARRNGILRVEYGAGRAWEFDQAGRLLRTEHRDRWRQFTLDQRCWGQRVVGSGTARRLQALDGESDATSRVRHAHAMVRALHAAVENGELHARTVRGEEVDAPRAARAWLAAAAGWTEARLAADRAQIRRLLLPVPVLPPDQYGALPIQLTEGCAWDACTFCSLYKGVQYHERTPEQLGIVLDELLSHLGPSVSRFRRLFLGQANALLLDDDLLHAHLDVIDARFPRVPTHLEGSARRAWLDERPGGVEGFAAFLDAFHRPRSVANWRRLRERGLLRVHIGVESGSERLLQELGKPVRIERMEKLLRTLHEADVPVGLIFLAGAGGVVREREHLDATAGLLGRLDLRAGDQVYLSPFVQRGDASERRFSLVAAHRLRERLRAVVPSHVPIAEYDLHLLSQRTPRG